MGPRPFMWYLLFNVGLQYVYFGLIQSQYDPIVSQFPPFMLYLWYYGMVSSCVLLLTGSSLFRKKFYGLLMQRIGAALMTLLSVANMFLIVKILDLSQAPILFAFISITTFAAASFWHYVDVGRYMKQLNALSIATLPKKEDTL